MRSEFKAVTNNEHAIAETATLTIGSEVTLFPGFLEDRIIHCQCGSENERGQNDIDYGASRSFYGRSSQHVIGE
jgi:hypothetical protein